MAVLGIVSLLFAKADDLPVALLLPWRNCLFIAEPGRQKCTQVFVNVYQRNRVFTFHDSVYFLKGLI